MDGPYELSEDYSFIRQLQNTTGEAKLVEDFQKNHVLPPYLAFHDHFPNHFAEEMEPTAAFPNDDNVACDDPQAEAAKALVSMRKGIDPAEVSKIPLNCQQNRKRKRGVDPSN